MFLCYISTQLFSNNLYTKCIDHTSTQLFRNNLYHFINFIHPETLISVVIRPYNQIRNVQRQNGNSADCRSESPTGVRYRGVRKRPWGKFVAESEIR
ncbi:putative transcription factor AP2-EREBP family [Helianthus anomalus]